MSIYYAILLGLLQGATEFLPISSSAHLALAESYLGIEQAGLTFDVALHLGTLAGVLIYFRNDLIKMGMAFLAPDRLGGAAGHQRRLAGYIILGTVPAVIAGLLLEGPAESIFRSPAMIAATLAGAGLLLWVADRTGRLQRKLDSLRLADALIIGLFQALAIMPGVSRSGITMTAGLFRGLNRMAAARFSFLLSVPVIMGAGVYKLPQIVQQGSAPGQFGFYLAGFLAAAVSGYLVIAFLLRFVQTHSFVVFVYYRFLLAALVLLGMIL